MAKDVSKWLVDNKDEISNWGVTLADTIAGAVANLRWLGSELSEFRALQQAGGLFNSVAGAGGYTAIFGPFTGGLIDFLNRSAETGADMRRVRGSRVGWGGMASATPPPRSPDLGYLDEKTGGAKRKPPRETDSEFRRFFEDRGFGVSRTFGAALNKGSLHPSGMAADVRIGGKSVAEVFALTAAALEKGYRLFDERQKRPGVKQTGPHLHFERGGSLKESSFLGAGMYGGPEQLAYLQALDARRLGKATGQAGFQDFVKDKAADDAELEREQNAMLRRMADEMIAGEQHVSDQRLTIRQKEADIALVMIETMVAAGEMTEIEAIRRVGELRVGMLEAERKELEEQIPTEENIQRLEEIRLELELQHVKNKQAELDYEKKITEEIEKQLRGLEKKNQRPGTMKKRTGPGEGTSFLDELYNATGQIQDMGDVWSQVGQMGTDIFMQLGQAIGSVVEQYVMLGEVSGEQLRRMVAQTLASVAAQAATYAIFHVAMGIAALTPWGAAMYGPAPLHFKAAAVWGAIAVGTALAGRAIAGDSGRATSSGRGSSSPGSTSSAGGDRNLSPYSRESADVYTSGRRSDPELRAIARAVEKLEKKIGSKSAGEILVIGSRQKKGFIANQFSEDVKSNSALGAKAFRSMGGR